ncbi:class I SAM-dependent DNA methyltransferase [Fictibacillus iocasae]|uniref:Uncharacterized methyltransferase ACFQPF_13720 n=1 Tax=Fictibacillus iocasae TaxID=2715437 RepID=A0ABW2NSB5_9BACL
MGREFIDLFDEWASSYDDTVSGHDVEYKEVFDQYEVILDTVAAKSSGNVLEFGVGTGNLTEKLRGKGLSVFGIEPSTEMRKKTEARFPDLTLFDGDFLSFPKIDAPISTIVSTYAFHHLTDEEKDKAIELYSQLLEQNGKIVFADTAYLHDEDRKSRHAIVQEQGFMNLLKDLQTEYYTTLEVLRSLFTKHGFSVSFTKMNEYVWLMEAVKK